MHEKAKVNWQQPINCYLGVGKNTHTHTQPLNSVSNICVHSLSQLDFSEREAIADGISFPPFALSLY